MTNDSTQTQQKLEICGQKRNQNAHFIADYTVCTKRYIGNYKLVCLKEISPTHLRLSWYHEYYFDCEIFMHKIETGILQEFIGATKYKHRKMSGDNANLSQKIKFYFDI